MLYDIIPDIHGQFAKLTHALTSLGYARRHGAWRHSEPGRTCVFLGDFIDRGPKNGDVIRLVREMLDAGTALAVMGNHELNAIHFHTNHPDTGQPLRPRSPKNLRQHQSFLDEFSPDSAATAEVIGWMRSLPLYLELDGFRAVHACWNEGLIAQLEPETTLGVLSKEQLVKAADPDEPLHDLVEAITKGPEISLPTGHSIVDKDGNNRDEIRVRWWNGDGRSWADIAMSVPNPADLPKGDLPAFVSERVYPKTAKPIFFGHYWLTGKPVLQAPNALCLDYSAGADGPLMSYCMDKDNRLALEDIECHDN
jgi:Calcineurin-like phosphoesterase